MVVISLVDTAVASRSLRSHQASPCRYLRDQLAILRLSGVFWLQINLSEALSRGSLLLAVESVDVKCLSAVDDLCSDGQRVCRALHGTIQSRLKALW